MRNAECGVRSWKFRRVVRNIDDRREGDAHANGHKQKQVKGASEKMRFDVWISLFFHFDLIGVHRRKLRRLSPAAAGRLSGEDEDLKSMKKEGRIMK